MDQIYQTLLTLVVYDDPLMLNLISLFFLRNIPDKVIRFGRSWVDLATKVNQFFFSQGNGSNPIDPVEFGTSFHNFMREHFSVITLTPSHEVEIVKASRY